jgi:proteasome lid subunit RPN8/RPN11
MVSLILTLSRAGLGRPPKLVCPCQVWKTGVAELHRRAGTHHESGAFLLGCVKGRTRRIEKFLFYDDIDPNCFRNGIVEFDGRQFGKVWQKCRSEKLMVVADVHVHPHGYGQSGTDRDNPMIAEAGHLAIILPNYAAKKTMPGSIGIYEYRGSRQWLDHSLKGNKTFHIGWWPR